MTVKDRLIKDLSKLPEAKFQSGHTELVIHCPFCKNENHKLPKFYIELDNDSCMRFNCFHGSCGQHGVLTPDVLHMLDINNSEYDTFLNSLNKKGISKIKTSSDTINNLIIPTKPKENDLLKIAYSSERTGVDFTNPANIKDYKLIYNLGDFININKLNLELDNNQIQEFSNHWIGFLGYNNNIINMRNVNSKRTSKRYTNIKINKSTGYSFLYMPPQEIDLLTSAPRIVLAEGAYDIICIKNRFYTKDANNVIFGAVGSAASYRKGAMKLFNLSCFFDADITIYGDQDVPIDFYYKKFGNLMKNNKFTLIRNKKNKDFGNINESYSLDIKKLN